MVSAAAIPVQRRRLNHVWSAKACALRIAAHHAAIAIRAPTIATLKPIYSMNKLGHSTP